MASTESERLSALIAEGKVLAERRVISRISPGRVIRDIETEARCFAWFHSSIGWIKRNFPKDDYVLEDFHLLKRTHEFSGWFGMDYPPYEFGHQDMLKMVAHLQALRGRLDESTTSPDAEMLMALLHPRIRDTSEGHYAPAVLEAYKFVNNAVKARYPSQELDGVALMSHAFGSERPVIRLTACETKSERDEQQGFMYLYMGAIQGIRNPLAHEDITQLDSAKAFEHLTFASLLLRRLDEALPPERKIAKP